MQRYSIPVCKISVSEPFELSNLLTSESEWYREITYYSCEGDVIFTERVLMDSKSLDVSISN
jgi:hypothetical protein